MKMKMKTVCAVLFFLFTAFPGFASEMPEQNHQVFEPLCFFHGTKLGFSLLLAGTAVTDPYAGTIERAAAGSGSSSQYTGMAAVTAGLAGAALSRCNLAPFRFEKTAAGY